MARMKLPDRETVAENLLTREEVVEYVKDRTRQRWSVHALDQVRRRQPAAGKPPFPAPVISSPRAHSPLWWRPDIDAWMPHYFPMPDRR